MKRTLEKNLFDWKNSPNHLPILLRGARQVGKTFIVEKFAKEHFKNSLTINFELRPEFKLCFDNLDPVAIINAITLLTDKNIIPNETLLFLDEIQECPNAIRALRYFKEKLPALHIIGAGSLLELTLNDAEFRMPVGRVQFLYLKPLSFQEFLITTNNEKLNEHLSEISLTNPITELFHQHLLKQVREYMIVGGMPAVTKTYVDTKNFEQCQNLQSALLQTYRNDFGKYATQTQYKYLQALFTKAPGLIAQQFKYSSINPDMRSRDIKHALEKLRDAGLLYSIYSTTASGLPFNTVANEKKFKILFLDIGLVKRSTQLDAEILLQKDLLLLNRGMLAEQFVGQELLAYSNPYEPGQLFFWTREKKNSTAEIDFVINVSDKIIPIEVKAGTTGRLKSLRLFMEEKNSSIGIRISQQPLSLENNILSVPIYMISEIPRLINELK